MISIKLITLQALWVSWLVAINATTFVAYAFDKRAAARQAWRIPERVLHILEGLGGSPAALLARELFRHKTQDRTFTRILFGIVGAQLLGLAAAGGWLFAHQ